MPDKKLLFISMLGEPSLYHPEDCKPLCASGLEKDWILSWYGDLVQKYDFEMVGADIIHGDELPDPDQFHSAILGGTIHLILEDRWWLKSILQWLQEYRKLQRPLIGICGGHQMIAVNFYNGNRLIKRKNGTLTGTHKIQLTESGKTSPLFQGIGDEPQFHFANDFHIVPSNRAVMNILAVMNDSPAVAVDYGYHWYGFQFHPEARIETWKCIFKRDSSFDLSQYKSDHAGALLIENFLKLSESLASRSFVHRCPKQEATLYQTTRQNPSGER